MPSKVALAYLGHFSVLFDLEFYLTDVFMNEDFLSSLIM